jgi:predicted glycosyltransferase
LDIAAQTKTQSKNDASPLSLIVMLSGSEFASQINFDSYNLPYKAEVIGRTGTNRENVIYHGRLWDNSRKLADADILVINGGFSAVSEAFIMKKYTLVIPVPSHAEQYINAILLQESGLGDIANEENVVEKLKNLFESVDRDFMERDKPEVNGNGAKEAADKILSIMRSSN